MLLALPVYIAVFVVVYVLLRLLAADWVNIEFVVILMMPLLLSTLCMNLLPYLMILVPTMLGGILVLIR